MKLLSKWIVLTLISILSLSAAAEPKSVMVCVKIIVDGDVNSAEGGFWPVSITDRNSNLTDERVLEVESYESSKHEKIPCTKEYPINKISGGLRVGILSPVSFEWMGNAQGYPMWKVIDIDSNDAIGTGKGYQTVWSDEQLSKVDSTRFKVIFTNKPQWYEKENGDFLRR